MIRNLSFGIKYHQIVAPAFCVFLMVLGTNFSYAQSDNNWTLYAEEKGVRLYAENSLCDDRNMLMLKLENMDAESKHINYNIIVESEGHNMPLRPRSLRLNGSETKTGTCEPGNSLAIDIKDITQYNLIVVLTVR